MALNLNATSYISVTSPLSQKTKFLIDSGSNISLIKKRYVSSQSEINTADNCIIRGVTDGAVSTFGSVNLTFCVQDFEFMFRFYVVPNNFPIPTEGLLGHDFLQYYQCLIDYKNSCLRIQYGASRATLPMSCGPVNGLLAVPPRCEVVRKIDFEGTEDQVVLPQELGPGVFVAGSIQSRERPYIQILNLTSKTVLVNQKDVTRTNLENFDVIDEQSSDSYNSPEHREEVMRILDKNFPMAHKRELSDLCRRFSHIFATSESKITVNNFYKQKLHLKDTTPVHTRQYPIPYAQRGEIKRQIGKMIDDGIIRHSNSEFSSPVFLVPKKSEQKEKKWRMVVDFRKINEKLVGDKFPIPRLEDCLNALNKAKHFSVIDLAQGFWQIPLEEESRKYTGFMTECGFFEFTRVPFGIKVAPNSFMRMMLIAFAGMTPQRAIVYMDDLVILGATQEDHLRNLEEVFKICENTNLKINPEKCVFFKPEVYFLGHKLTEKGILPDDRKFEAVLKWPTPTNPDECRRFAAFANYFRMFIPRFAELAQPIYSLSSGKPGKFLWTQKHDECFNRIKSCITQPPCLAYPDFDQPFVVTSDASMNGVGATLSQEHTDKPRVIAFASCSFSKSDLHKSIVEKELIGIHYAIDHFKPYLFGTRFLVRTDCKSLIYLFKLRKPSSRLNRMRIDLEEYDFEIEHVEGKSNVLCDGLSRIHIKDLASEYQTVLRVTTRLQAANQTQDQATKHYDEKLALKKTIEQNQEAPLNLELMEAVNVHQVSRCPEIRFSFKENVIRIGYNMHRKNAKILLEMAMNEKMMKGVKMHAIKNILKNIKQTAAAQKIKKLKIKNNDEMFEHFPLEVVKEASKELKKEKINYEMTIMIYEPPKEIKDKKLQNELLEKIHESPIIGAHSGYGRLIKKLKCKFYWKGMKKDALRITRNCPKCKLNKPSRKTLECMTKTYTPQKPFDVVEMDIYVLPVQDLHGYRYVLTLQCNLTKFLILVPMRTKSAKETATALFENLMCLHGFPKAFKTDCGSEFKNEIFKKIEQLSGIKHNFAVPYNPTSLGQIERGHRTLSEYLRNVVTSKNEWSQWLPHYAFAYNSTPSPDIANYSPYELIYGRSPNLPLFLNQVKVKPIYDYDDYAEELRYRLHVAHRDASLFQEKVKESRKRRYDLGARPVRFRVGDKVKMFKEVRDKLDAWYLGPYEVVELRNPNIVLKDPEGKTFETHVNKVAPYGN